MPQMNVDETGNVAHEIWENSTGPLSVRSDGVNNYVLTKDSDNRLIKDGYAFRGTLIFAAIGSGATLPLALVVPNVTSVPHLELSIKAQTAAWFKLTEGATRSGTATAITSYNINRNSAIAPNLVLQQYGTGYALGTNIGECSSYSGKEGIFKIILKSNKTYIAEIKSDVAQDLIIAANWIENI